MWYAVLATTMFGCVKNTSEPVKEYMPFNFTGHVHNCASNKPYAGAYVYVSTVYSGYVRPLSKIVGMDTTDENGNFDLKIEKVFDEPEAYSINVSEPVNTTPNYYSCFNEIWISSSERRSFLNVYRIVPKDGSETNFSFDLVKRGWLRVVLNDEPPYTNGISLFADAHNKTTCVNACGFSPYEFTGVISNIEAVCEVPAEDSITIEWNRFTGGIKGQATMLSVANDTVTYMLNY